MTTTSQLATRCSACGTAFRVVQDQLKVSEGWVRCGRCDTVFNAQERLFDLRLDPLSPSAAGETGAPAHEALPELPSDDAPRPPLAPAFSALLKARGDAGGGATGTAPVPPSMSAGGTAAFTAWPALPSAQPAVRDFAAGAGLHAADADAELEAQAASRQARVDLLLDVPGDPPAPHRPIGAVEPDAAMPADVDGGSTDAGSAPTPEFVRAAERDARWRRPPVRRALLAASVVLALVLALQAAHQFRDGVAARWPSARPWLAGWCEQLGCTVGPLRRIADVTVENTALAPLGAVPGTFQLALTLRNRGALAVALPAVDLSLTDSNGQLVARRALAPADFHVADRPPGGAVATTAAAPATAAGLLGPDTDTRLQTALSTDARVVGYTVELFYP